VKSETLPTPAVSGSQMAPETLLSANLPTGSTTGVSSVLSPADKKRLESLVASGVLSKQAQALLLAKLESKSSDERTLLAHSNAFEIMKLVAALEKIVAAGSVDGVASRVDERLAIGGIAKVMGDIDDESFAKVARIRHNDLDSLWSWVSRTLKIVLPEVNPDRAPITSVVDSSGAVQTESGVVQQVGQTRVAGRGIDVAKFQEIMNKYSKGRRSVISAAAFIKTCEEHGFDPALALSMAIMESNVGTAGDRSLRTKNMFNVGNDDAGNNRYFATWEQGLVAYIDLMKRRYGSSLAELTASNPSLACRGGSGYYCEAYSGAGGILRGSAAAKAYGRDVIALGNRIAAQAV
jgi:hypothetical protein